MQRSWFSRVWSGAAAAFVVGTVVPLAAGCASGAPDTGEDVEDVLGDDDTVGTTRSALGVANLAGNIHAHGSFVCDFGIPSSVPGDQVPPVIERDRTFMSARPGMVNKYLPLAIDPDNGDYLSGGRYLFDTFIHAAQYEHWVKNKFALDGVLFLERPIFMSPDCYSYAVLQAHDFDPDPASHVVVRVERFETNGLPRVVDLVKAWADAKQNAAARNLAGVWLMTRPDLRRVQLVYYGRRVGPTDPNVPDFASLGALAAPSSLLPSIPSRWHKTFDRSSFVWTIWSPFEPGDQGAPSQWINSPPLPAPFCGDGVCEASRGENGSTCAADCVATCGNAICNAGENNFNCPGDCRSF